MENSIYIGLSKQSVLRTNMGIIANNIANMNTPGFRAQNLVFEEVLRGEGSDGKGMSLVDSPGMYEDTASGTVRQTRNMFDLALTGPGFFEVRGPGGETTYTRAGNLQLSSENTLVTAAGYEIISNGGAVVIPEDISEFTIDQAGIVYNEQGEIGQVSVVEFGNLQRLEAMGENLYRAGDNAQPRPATDTRVLQGALESSNVNGVLETTRMISVLRENQSLQNFISNETDRVRDVIRKLTEA